MIRIETPEDLGETLTLLRQLAGITQRELATASGISQTEISLYEHGSRVPRLAKLLKYLAAVGWGVAIVPLNQTAPETGLSASVSEEQASGVDGSRGGNSKGSTGHTGGDA